MVVTTKPIATKNINTIGIYAVGEESVVIWFYCFRL